MCLSRILQTVVVALEADVVRNRVKKPVFGLYLSKVISRQLLSVRYHVFTPFLDEMGRVLASLSVPTKELEQLCGDRSIAEIEKRLRAAAKEIAFDVSILHYSQRFLTARNS